MAATSSSAPKRVVVLISGSGSNLQAIIDATRNDGRLAGVATVTQVLSNRKAAYGLTRAQNVGIPTAVLSLKTWLSKHDGKTREDYDAVLANAVLAGGEGESSEAIESGISSTTTRPDLIVLAGFMHIVSPRFLAALHGVPCINLHPALPGQFDGIDAIKRAHDAFTAGSLPDNKTGVMVHEVIAEVDRGAPIVVRDVACRQGESLQELEERIHAVEHEIIVEATYVALTR